MLPEEDVWVPGVYRVEDEDPVQGGDNGIDKWRERSRSTTPRPALPRRPGGVLPEQIKRLGAWSISDGTITFKLSGNVIVGKTPTIAYNGSNQTFKAVATGDTITAFSKAVTNNSTDTSGIPSGTSARNLGVIVLGHDPTSAAEVTQVCTMIHKTIAAGNIDNLVIGDYFALASVTIAAGNDAGGAFSASLADITGHGRNLDFVLVSKNPYKNKNGNTFDHVIFHSRNVLSAMTANNAGGHYMNMRTLSPYSALLTTLAMPVADMPPKNLVLRQPSQ